MWLVSLFTFTVLAILVHRTNNSRSAFSANIYLDIPPSPSSSFLYFCSHFVPSPFFRFMSAIFASCGLEASHPRTPGPFATFDVISSIFSMQNVLIDKTFQKYIAFGKNVNIFTWFMSRLIISKGIYDIDQCLSSGCFCGCCCELRSFATITWIDDKIMLFNK